MDDRGRISDIRQIAAETIRVPTERRRDPASWNILYPVDFPNDEIEE